MKNNYELVQSGFSILLGAMPDYSGLAQPESEPRRGALTEGSLLELVGTDVVQTTPIIRKVTYGGNTKFYPVYWVRLDALYYNDQNDRIATWISRYEAENGPNSLSGLNTESYNRIIEDFICESDPDIISKTQKNIALVGQREPGITLADGRIVDGNRRFTCLRRLARAAKEPLYFETVLIDEDTCDDKKQIKLLELAIQHGDEKKVDYDGQIRNDSYRDYFTEQKKQAEQINKTYETAGIYCKENVDRSAEGNAAIAENMLLSMEKAMLRWGTKQKREYLYDENGRPVLDDAGHHKYNAVHTTDWSDRETLEKWRRAWAELCNREFEKKGLACRIDHRSYKEQGIEQTPTVHEGVAVREMEKRGIRTDKGERNRIIRSLNTKIKQGERTKMRIKLVHCRDKVRGKNTK